MTLKAVPIRCKPFRFSLKPLPKLKGNRHPDGKNPIEKEEIEVSLPEDLPGVKPAQASIPTGREEMAAMIAATS